MKKVGKRKIAGARHFASNISARFNGTRWTQISTGYIAGPLTEFHRWRIGQ